MEDIEFISAIHVYMYVFTFVCICFLISLSLHVCIYSIVYTYTYILFAQFICAWHYDCDCVNGLGHDLNGPYVGRRRLI